MANYLALIRKADFVDLFKYGSLHVNKDMIRQFSCKVEELSKRYAIFDDLSYFANSFDSTFAYLFIHYEKNGGRDNDINIADVRGIYPLDNEAKTELSLSLDSRIKINEPLWPNAIFNLQKKQTLQDCKNGASNIWKIYNLSESINDINSIISDDVLSEVVDELYSNRRPVGKLPIWVYLMRYERHAFYPNNTIGSFMDAAHAISSFLNGRELDSAEIESTMIMQFFSYCNDNIPNMTFKEVLQKLSIQKETSIVSFLSEVKSIGNNNIDLLKTATLYFIYRNRYKENFRYEEQWEKAGKTNGKEFAFVCYMLGCVLGHEHTYDCLYEHLPLAIFNKELEEKVPETLSEKKVYIREEFPERTSCMGGKNKNLGNQIDESIIQSKQQGNSSLFGETEMVEMKNEGRKTIKFPLTLQKYTKNRKPSKAKNANKIINTEEEYRDFMNSTNEDWRIKI